MRYIVKSGDTLTGIGAQYGVSWVTIANTNGLRAPYRIFPGEALNIPAATPTVAGPQPYQGQPLAQIHPVTTAAGPTGTISSGTALPNSLGNPLGMVINGVILYGLFRVVMKVL